MRIQYKNKTKLKIINKYYKSKKSLNCFSRSKKIPATNLKRWIVNKENLQKFTNNSIKNGSAENLYIKILKK